METNIMNDPNLWSSTVQGEVCKYAANQHNSSLNVLSNKINDAGTTKPPQTGSTAVKRNNYIHIQFVCWLYAKKDYEYGWSSVW